MNSEETFAYWYSTAYYIVLLLLSMYAALSYSRNNSFLNKGIGWPLAIALILFFAFRPLTYKFGFGDTQGYAFFFNLMKTHKEIDLNAKDIGFECLSFFLRYNDVWVLFLVLAVCYTVCQLLASKLLSPSHYGVLFLIIVLSFSFWGYGVNGARNGAAIGLVMLGMIKRNIVWTPILFLLGISLHGSVLLPIAAYCLNFAYSKSKSYVIVWCVCVVLSLFVSDFLTETLTIGDFIDDRRVAYLTNKFDKSTGEMFASTGYRWDFVIYSAIPIILGYIQIKKKVVTDRIYIVLFNTYCICNSFWLFTIYVPYNNRFAYLSWFLFPILVTYPFISQPGRLSDKNVSNVRKVIALTYLFTFIMWLK